MMQKQLAIVLITLAVLAAAAVAGCTSSPGGTATPTASAGTSAASYQIVITGGNVSPVTVTYADLRGMKTTELKNATMVKMNGVPITSDWVGVPLADILAKAGLPAGNLTLTMTAPDGFQSVYPLSDLDGAMLGLEKNGTMLDADVNGDNPIQLVIDQQIGHDWIKVPTAINISKS